MFESLMMTFASDKKNDNNTKLKTGKQQQQKHQHKGVAPDVTETPFTASAVNYTNTAAHTTKTTKNNNNNNNNNFDNDVIINNNKKPNRAVVESLVAKELNEMTPEERNRVFFDIHGIASDTSHVNETPQAMSLYFKQIKAEIAKLAPSCQAYKIVDSFIKARLLKTPPPPPTTTTGGTNNNNNNRSSTGITDNYDFLIKFLRADNYNPKLAAARIMKYFEYKKDLYPDNLELVIQEIVPLNAHSTDDIEAIRCGYVQVVPSRDQGGRTIILFQPSLRVYKELKNLLRSVWYMLMVAAQDGTNQKLGVVQIVYNIGQKSIFDPQLVKELAKLREAIPLKSSSIHNCINDPILRIVAGMAMLALGRQTRLRFRTHYGSHKEVQLALQGHGVPSSVIPIDKDGISSIEGHVDWCDARLEIESKENNNNDNTKTSTASSKSSKGIQNNYTSFAASPVIQVPNYYDVLFGRGKNVLQHPGNIRFHLVIDFYRDAYESSNRSGKSSIVDDIYNIVQSSGGRFLKKQEKEEDTSNNNKNDDNDNNNKNNDSDVTMHYCDPCTQYYYDRIDKSRNDVIISSKKQQQEEKKKKIIMNWYIVTQDIARDKITQAFRTKKAITKQFEKHQQYLLERDCNNNIMLAGANNNNNVQENATKRMKLEK